MSKVSIVIIAAVGENGVIGTAGGLPWRVSADLRRFRKVTMGKPLVMGRKTFESIGRALDGRDTIVVSRQPGFGPEGVIVAASLEAAVEKAEACAAARGVGEICVAGGGEIYAAALPRADRLYITHVAAAPQGDTAFPEISPAEWVEVSREPLPAREGDTAGAEYVTYERRPHGSA